MKYLNIGEEVSVEGAVVQAAQALDIAGKYAQQARDTATLLRVAESWTKVADFMVALSEHEDKQEKEKNKADIPFGIQPTKSDIDSPETDETEYEQLEITVEEE